MTLSTTMHLVTDRQTDRRHYNANKVTIILRHSAVRSTKSRNS